MAYDYDKLYASQPHALGEPSPIFRQFFEGLAPGQSLNVLDVGCGQGRDALFVARLGHRVLGLDTSPAGIRDLQQSAQAESLSIRGLVTDVRTFETDERFDILLIDRTLHMLDKDDRGPTLAKLLDFLSPQAWLLLADESSNMPIFKQVLLDDSVSWDITKDSKGSLFACRTP